MKTVGIIGTAKNTGKTTTLSFILEHLLIDKINVAVTSIGYDGEEFDNITNLPKPRLLFKENSIIATSEKCLVPLKAKYDIIEKTDLQTALGKIIIIKTKEPEKIVIAGPNTSKDLSLILKLLIEKTDCETVLVDGSLNRIAPMYILDKLIFTTGASRSTNIDQLTKEMLVVEKLFSFSQTTDCFSEPEQIKIKYSNETNYFTSPLKTIIDNQDVLELEKYLNNRVEKIVIPNLISLNTFINHFQNIAQKINRSFTLVFKSPMQLLISQEFLLISILLDQCEKYCVDVQFLFKPELSAITINPFYPKLENFIYKQSYINKDELFRKMSNSLKTPVINIFEPGSEKILELI